MIPAGKHRSYPVTCQERCRFAARDGERPIGPSLWPELGAAPVPGRPGLRENATNRIAGLRHRLRPALLRWAVGVFCALIGGLMLVAPHQFGGPTFLPIRPWLAEAGVFFFLAGVALVLVSAVGVRGPLAVAAGVGTGSSLLTLAASFALTGAWTGA